MRDAYRRADFDAVYTATQHLSSRREPFGEFHLLRARALLRQQRAVEVEELLAGHLAGSGDADLDATAAMLHASAVARRSPDEGLALLVDAERTAKRRRAHPSILAEIAYRRATTHWMRGELGDAERLARSAENASFDVLAVRATHLLGFVAVVQGRFVDALAIFARARLAYGRCREHDIDLASAVQQQIATLEQTLRCDVIRGTHADRDGRTIPRATVGLGGPSASRTMLCGDDAWLFALDGDGDRAYSRARESELSAPSDAWRVRGLSYRAAMAGAFDEPSAARSFAEEGAALAERVAWDDTSEDERFSLLSLADVLAPLDVQAAGAMLDIFDRISTPMATNRVVRHVQDNRVRGWTAFVRGSVARYQGQTAQAVPLLTTALEAFRACGYRWREAQTLMALDALVPAAHDGEPASKMDQAIDLIARHFPESFLARRVDGWARLRLDPHGATLSPAQREVLRHLLEGRTPREIAAIKDRGYETIRTHISALHRAFGTRSEHQLVATCAARGILSPRADRSAPQPVRSAATGT